MNKAHTNINYENAPSTATPLNEHNLNATDRAVDIIDDRVIVLDTSKADKSELLGMLSNVAYNTVTGVFTFTYLNGTTFTVDLNIEKIPVSFTMSKDGVITMTNTDGTKYTCDVSSLIKTYSFANSSTISVKTTTDASGNKTFEASIIDGSVTENKLQPNFLADCRTAKAGAVAAETGANSKALESEGYALGTQNGVDVPSTSPYYHNNAKYYSDKAGASTLTSLTDTDIQNPKNGDTLKYSSGKWVNGSVSSSEVKRSNGVLLETSLQSIESTANSHTTEIANNTSAIGNMRTIISGTLAAGETSITLRDSRFVDGAIVDLWQYIDGEEVPIIGATKMTVGNGFVTLYYDALETDVIVGARCF